MDTINRYFPSLAVLALLFSIVLTGCDLFADNSDLLPENQVYPTKAMTWKEWVAYESPHRNGFDSYYHIGKGYPNISLWKPEDFLPAEMFNQPHPSVVS